jgi:bifunctional UDP-N-acetylglucosamine pyrophosphorylase/glucosamine-1-phosphate N-acetyltransferase
VLNHSQPAELVKLASERNVFVVFQPTQDGTGGALTSIIHALDKQNTYPEYLLVMNGDMPCIRTQVIEELVGQFRQAPHYFYMVGTRMPFETQFGKVFQNNHHLLIREDRECSKEEKEHGLVNTGIYWFPVEPLKKVLGQLPIHQPKQEKFITDLFGDVMVRQAGLSAKMIYRPDWTAFVGLNDLKDLHRAERILTKQRMNELMDQGVRFYGSPSVLEETVQIGAGSEIFPGTCLMGDTRIGKHCQVETGSTLKNAEMGDHSVLLAGSYVEDSRIGSHCKIGPNAHLRSQTQVGDHCRVGNYVEMKKTQFGDGSKSAHLTYLGDCVVGKNVNVGCGVITCNYDGVNKHTTVIDDGAFIGSDVQLIAPIRIGKRSYIASGSTITENLNPDDFAIARERQTTKPGLAKKLLNRKRKS